jgi:hypothetical protein
MSINLLKFLKNKTKIYEKFTYYILKDIQNN